jgi:hypothetical protein
MARLTAQTFQSLLHALDVEMRDPGLSEGAMVGMIRCVHAEQAVKAIWHPAGSLTRDRCQLAVSRRSMCFNASAGYLLHLR